jgi:hypothetical protein
MTRRKFPSLCAGEKGSPAQRRHTGQNLAQFAQKGGAPRSQLVVASYPYEQFISQFGAQPVELSTHRGLAEMNAFCSPGYITLVQ